jgi:zinc protease
LTLGYPVAQHRLDNGLRVVASEDHVSPAVTVHLQYDVGSRHEEPGRTGLAHLAEHLMFEGSRNVRPGEHAELMRACGAVYNGATDADLTVYFEHLPAGALELAFWLEADRMATVVEGLDQELLDAQRGVITQERHQRYDNVPYGNIEERLLALVYPAGHPYQHPVIGSLADLQTATVAEVAQFFRTWYAPGNAVLAVTGDIEPEQVFDAAQTYFGPIPGGPRRPPVPARVLGPAVARCRDDAVETVPGAMTALGFRLPPDSVTDPGMVACDLALRILADGKASRAHQVLVRELKAARQVQAHTDSRVGGNSLGVITVSAMPADADADADADAASAAASADVIEEVLTAELGALATSEPGELELACALAAAERELLATVSRSQGRAFYLAYFTAAFGDPDLINTAADRLRAITPAQVREAAAEWLIPDRAAIVTTSPAPSAVRCVNR